MAQNPLELERVRYWQGQLLASGDLNTQLRVDQRLRWLHNRSLHQPYGIAIGLDLERDESTHEIKVDDDNINVICGLAYDCAGRELILQANRAVALPDQFPATLVITRDETTVDGITLKWKARSQVNPNIEIAITTLTQGLPNPKADPAFRPVVSRPLARPRVATGQTIPGETTWQRWKIGENDVGVKVEIDTSAAGFTQIPHYFAEVIPGNPTDDFIPAWFASIDNPSTQGFTFQLMLRRITRETLRIVDPKGQITQAPSANLTLDQSNLFVPGDMVARLLPLAEDAAIIKTLSGSTANLDKALKDFSGEKPVAFGNTRREAKVKDLPSSLTFFEVTVTKPDLFLQGDVVVKINGDLASTRPSHIVAIGDDGTLEVLPTITGLAIDDSLAPVKPASAVVDIGDGTNVTVGDASLYKANDVVVRLTLPVESSAPTTITQIKAGNVIVLSKAIPNLANGNSLGFAREGTKVEDITDNSKQVRIELDNATPFRSGDLVAKNLSDGKFSAPVLLERVFSNNKVDLSRLVPGLAENDTIVGGSFSVRATVTEIITAKSFKVARAALFPKDSYIARIDKLFAASTPVQVQTASGDTITLLDPINGLQQGDVIALCTFPVAVNFVAKRDDGSLEVSPPGLLQQGDLIAAPATMGEKTRLALITNVTGNVISVTKPFPNLIANDRLSVVSIRGATNASHANGDAKTEVDQPKRLRVGDFLADITSWRQSQESTTVQFVNGNQIQLVSALDGSLLNDVVGLASITFESSFFFFFFVTFLIQLRLEKSPDILISDQVLLIGFDRLTGKTHNLFASVRQFVDTTKTLILQIITPGSFTWRPEDISASILFVRGDPMALIQKHDLFVSWLAVGDSGPMPRPCIGAEAADCDCSQVKE